MVVGRRPLVRIFAITALMAASVAGYAGIALAAPSLWECNWCHQQYQGDSLPAALRFAKCPAKELKQNHFWSKKG
jgi:hypothetical protein